MLEDAGIDLLLTQERLVSSLPDSDAEIISLDTEWHNFAQLNTANPAVESTESTAAYVIFTSGSTGRPKGVLNEHKGICNRLLWMQDEYGLNAGDSVLQKTPFSFDVSVWEFFWPLQTGARLVLAKPGGHRDSAYLANLIQEENITTLHFVPSMLQVFLQDPQATQCASLRRVFCSGEALPRDLQNRFHSLMSAELHNLYGPTEAAVDVTYWACTPDDTGSSVPIGRPVANTQIYIVDRHAQPVPPGVAGELWIGGVQVSRGYINRPELTAEKFIADPFSDMPGARVYRTGDLARYRRNGVIEFLGRIDFQIKLRGFRIELGEIEARLDEHPSVRQSIVLLREDTPGDPRLVAYVAASTSDISEDELHGWQDEQVQQWQTLWQEEYSQASTAGDAGFDIQSWNSSYTGEQIPAEDMRHWLDSTTTRIRELNPVRAIEIGSGSGMIVNAIAPDCEHFVATDFSAASIGRLGALLSTRPELSHVDLRQCAAEDIGEFTAREFDTVILNSVAQYFPHVEYLRAFLEAAIAKVSDGGYIFLGDLRSLPLLQTYHASVQLYQAADELPAAELAEQIDRQTRQEEELLLDPAFFTALQAQLPRLAGVRFELKRGRDRNELSRFRYDVVLLVGERQGTAAPRHLDWNSSKLDLNGLNTLLEDGDANGLLVTAIPDARTQSEVAILAGLDNSEADTAGGLRELQGASAGGIEPEDLYAAAARFDLDLQLIGNLPGEISALFRKVPTLCFDGEILQSNRPEGWSEYANDPLHGKLQRSLVPALKQHLGEELPDYMVPASFVVIDEFPLSPNGKIDRKKLPAPERKREDRRAYVAPRDATEEQLAAIWSEVLGIKQIGVHDDFFGLGGHSLLATQLVSRVRDRLRAELPLMVLFNHPTIAGLAKQIATTQGQEIATIEPCDRSEPLPLSFAQQRLWFLNQLEGNSATYNVPVALELTGELNIAALQSAINELAERHESLRTSFATWQGTPTQVVHAASSVPLDLIDLTGAQDDVVQERLEDLVQQPFDLQSDQLVRVHVLRTSEHSCRLLLVMHHIVSDGWSLGILARELAASYAAHVNNTHTELPELTIQYADFAVWQRNWLVGAELDRQLSFWAEHLADAPELLQLPTDHPRPAIQTFTGAHLNRNLGLGVRDALKQLAGDADVTLFMLLFAAFDILLSRYSGSDDIVVGTPIAGRNRSEIEGLIGFFVNTLVLRTDLSGNPRFMELLERVRRAAMAAYDHQDLPFEKLVEELQPEREISHPPIFQVLFVLQESLAEHIRFEGMEVTPLDFELGTAKFDLSMFLVDLPDGLTASIEYNTDLFEATTIERMLDHFETLLAGIAANPEARLSEFSLLREAERRHVLRDFNESAMPVADLSVVELVERQVSLTPDAVALTMRDDSLSYAELNAQANRLARHLAANGAGPGQLIGISCERSVEMAVGVLAALKSGAAYVPIDPNYPAERVSYMLEDSNAPVLLTQSVLLDALPETAATVVCVDTFDFASGDGANLEVTGESVYAIYTSGSTGQPKGVELTHAGLSNLVQWQCAQPGLDMPARTLQFASLSFDVSFQELFTTWAQGGTVVLVDEELRRDLPRLAKFIATDGIERVYLPYAALQPLADSVANSGLSYNVRDVIVAGEQLQVTPPVRQMFDVLEGARLHNQYGPSETHVVTAFTLTGDSEHWMALPPIGTPVANTRVYVLDDNREPVPVGVPGELYLGGVQVAKGYIHRPELTAEKFLPDPFVADQDAGQRMYKTGDRVRFLDDGNIEYLGRTDDQVKWRGFRIEPGEIEARLAEHTSVQQAAVLLREDSPGDKRLVGYVVAAPNQAIDVPLVRAWLKDQVPDYMVPSALVILDSMPLTPSGKVARSKLPLPDYAEVAQAYVAPRTPVEETLVEIWADVLGLSKANRLVGIHDDFFDLGGHSLLATQLISRVRDALEVELPLITLFNHPNVAEFAADVAAASGITPAAPIPLCDRSKPLPLSFAQQRLWFLDQLEPGNPVYNIPWAMRLDGPLNLQALQAAIDDLVQRHEALRTLFSVTMGKPQQCVLEKTEVPLESVDATGDTPEQIEQRLYNLSRMPFGLGQTPLMRVHILHVANQRHIILLVMHHIIADGWSLGVLYQELVTLYKAHCTSKHVILPPLPLQYADYAVWQQDWFRSSEQQRQLDYWKQQLHSAPALLDLPTDRPRGATQTYNGAYVDKILPNAIHAGLKDLARRENSTLFMVGLAAFNVLLARYSGQSDICVGAPVAGRQHTELEGLIGFFINTLVMRNDLSGEPDFSECLARIKRTALEAFAHQDLPFEKLVDEIHPVRDMSHAPLFQVAFILQNTPWDNGAELHDLKISPIEIDYGVAKFDLSLVMAERREGLLVHFEYNTDLFDRSTIERLTNHFETLLLAIVSDPQQPVATMPLLSANERQQILYEWNDTQAPYADDTYIHTLIEQRAAAQPDAPAILFQDTVVSFGELNERANQIAHYLINEGAVPGSIIGLCLERSVDLVAGLLGILKSGAAYVPLDPKYPSERLQWMLEDSAAALIVTHSNLLAQLPEHSARNICLDLDWPVISRCGSANPECRASEHTLAYVIYTSGSTGKPKGVMIEHQGVCNLADAQARCFGLGPDDRMLQFASISFDASIFEIVMGLQVGAAMVLAPQDDLLPGEPLLHLLKKHAVTAVTLPPTALSQLPPGDLPALHTITVAGEACPPELVEAWAVNRRFFNLYGPTESTVWASYQQCEPGQPVTIGRPISNARLYVLDEYQQPVPVGVAGELCIGGAGLARGYLNRPELSAEKFLPDPFRNDGHARIYRTGDLVRYRPDSNIEFLGRIDHQVKVRGFRIELGEIEAVLAGREDIREAVVVARGASLQDKQLVAYIIPRSGSGLSLTELRSYLKQSLPEFMVPGAFVELDAFPLTPNGKVDRAALPSPDDQRMATEEAYVAPRTAAEKMLADIWCTLLNVARVGVNDNFFELGGDSILSIQIIARAALAGLRLTPKQLFQHQTIAELAAVAGSEVIAAEQETLTGDVPLTPIQHWFTQRRLAEPWHFNQAMLLESDTHLDAQALQQALGALLIQHDALRLRLEESTARHHWSQHMAAPDESDSGLLDVLDLGAMSAADQQLHYFAAAEKLQCSFDLQNGPILRGLLVRRGTGQKDQLLICIHHIAVDWVSWKVLLEDLEAAYSAAVAGEPAALPAKTSSFRAWAEHLVNYANSTELLAELPAWSDKNWANVARLPRDHANGDNTESSMRDVTVELPEELTRILHQELPKTQRSKINEGLLAAILRVLNKWTGGESLAINLEGHGREELFDDIDLSRTVGWFTSLYPVLLQSKPADDRGQTLRAVKETLRNLPNNGIGFGILRYLSDQSARLENIPEPEIGFNYLGQYDQVSGQHGLLQTAVGYRGHEQSPVASRPHVLDIHSVITGGRLQVSLIYSENLHTRATIEMLAGEILEELSALAEYCRTGTDVTYTPADFPLAHLDQATLDKIVPAGTRVDDIYPVTALQHGMLFHSLFTGEKDVYFARFAWRLAGHIDMAAFEQAWQQVIDRHTSLRTSFYWKGLSKPVQIVNEKLAVAIRYEDWSDLPAAEQDQQFAEFLDQDQRERFDFTLAPLLRLVLIKLDETDHRFIWSFHHAIIDGWSVPLVLKEVFAHYALLTGRAGEQPGEAIPFVEYIKWLDQQDTASAEQFWRKSLVDFSSPTPLPGQKAQSLSPAESGEFRELQARLPVDTVAKLREIAQRQRLTLNTLVQGTWALILNRYSGETDVLFGATTSGRPAAMPGVESMIGLFLNTLPLRVTVSNDTPLLDWLHALQETQLEVRQHEYSSLVEIQGWSDVPRGTPMFESLLAFENYPEMETMWTSTDNIEIREVDGFDRTNFPLTVNVAVFDEMIMRIAYDDRMFDHETIARITNHFKALLSAVAEDPARTLGELPMLTSTEAALLEHWNETARDYPADITLVDLFEQQVDATPDATALACESEQLSYAELNSRANQLAHYLRSRGIGPDCAVGVCMERSIEMVIALYAVIKAGGAYVPLDPDYPRERLAHMLEDANIRLLLTQQAVTDSLPEHAIDTLQVDTSQQSIAEFATTNPEPLADPHNLAYIIFTSGSTGRPKGVMNEHRGICNRLLWMQDEYQLDSADRVLQKTPFSFDVSVWEFFWPLMTGAQLVLAKPGGHRDTTYLARLIDSAAITTVHFVPSMLQVFLQDPNAGACNSLKRVICSGEALPFELQERFFATLDAQLHNLYGPTEAAIDVSYWACERDSDATSVPIGRPVANTQLFVVDSSGQRVPIGVPGELWIAGVQVARGYINRPELSTAAFGDDPFSDRPGARVYKTGDLARWRADGAIEYLGRIDHQVKLRGFRIELGEIETQLDALDEVQQSVVLLREDVPDLKQLVAYVITENAATFDAEAAKNALGRSLPDYMLPTTIIALPDFPLTPNGKIDRNALPAPDAPATQNEYAAPRNETEEQLAKLWTELLGAEQVGIYDDFFALGGHSLVAMQMVSRIMATMQIELPLDALFNSPTIAGLAENIANDGGANKTSAIKSISRTERRTRRPR
jgi:amino acid adenylation domain-containing protein/non-ribosomal peptide synthase protein (TIGR01720 family)